MANLDIIIRTLGAGRAKDELDALADGVRRAGVNVGGMNVTLADLAGGLYIAQSAFRAVAGAAEAAYAELQRGGELLKIAGQFETLTQKVNSTADAMLGKLKAATRGMVSDAELMASAGRIISLGLAKTEEDTVRLATVVAGLGLDMQQVIMTFANDSKMRLDALGLSVEGVDKKVEELKAQGFEGDAFDQAVLLGLEERYGELGVSVDSVAGAMARLEAAAADARDAFSMAFAEGMQDVLAETADGANAAASGLERFAESWGAAAGRFGSSAMGGFAAAGAEMNLLEEALQRNIITQEVYDGQMNRLLAGFRIKKSLLKEITTAVGLLDKLGAANAETTEDLTTDVKQLAVAFYDLDPAIAAVIATGYAYGQMVEDNVAATERFKQALRDAYAAQSSPFQEYRGYGGTMDPGVAMRIKQGELAYAGGGGSSGTGGGRNWLSSYVSEAQRVMDANAQLNGSFLSLYDIIQRGGELPDPFTAMFESAARAGASIGTVLDLGEAIGRDRGQMEQAAKASFQQEFAGQLGQRIAQGMSIEDALREMEEFNQALEDGTATIDEMADPNNTVALDSMQAKLAHDRLSAVKEMMEKINNTRSTVYVDVVYSERGKPGGPLYDKAGQRGEGG